MWMKDEQVDDDADVDVKRMQTTKMNVLVVLYHIVDVHDVVNIVVLL